MSNHITDAVDPIQVDGLDISYENDVCVIKLNKPKKRNAVSLDMYDGIQKVLSITASQDSVKFIYITGTGEYFSSGMDLSSGPPKARKDPITVFKEFVDAFINYPKVIVVGVNGPAVGIGVTILGLVDFVYASDTATFYTPFVKLGLCPEGCSSYTFPKIMGYAQASEMLIASRKLSAREAFDRKLVTEVFCHNKFQKKVNEKIRHLAALPTNAMLHSKALVFNHQKDTLLKVNEEECERLSERFASDEFRTAVVAHFAKASKM